MPDHVVTTRAGIATHWRHPCATFRFAVDKFGVEVCDDRLVAVAELL